MTEMGEGENWRLKTWHPPEDFRNLTTPSITHEFLR
jgi:hypothetical protein